MLSPGTIMNMKKLALGVALAIMLALLSLVLFQFLGSELEQDDLAAVIPEATDESPQEPDEPKEEAIIEPKGPYAPWRVLFSINVHDFLEGEQSAEALNTLIDIHETYQVPVDVYLTDPSFETYMEEAPELLERMRDSDLVSISHHVRPPSPYYSGFDWVGLKSLSESALKELLYTYETESLDPVTGEPSGELGGFFGMKEYFGYAPLAVGNTSSKVYGSVLSSVYDELGAVFASIHGRDIEFGETHGDQYARPEHAEIKIYEYPDGNAEEVIESFLQPYESREWEGLTSYTNIKIHENDLYSRGTSWLTVYYEDGSGKSIMDTPPYDLGNAYSPPKPPDWSAGILAVYEDAVRYVSGFEDRFDTINLSELAEELP